MKKILASLVVLVFLVPSVSFAQTTVDTSPQYISLLKEMLALLEQELQIILATQSTVSNIATTTSAIQSTVTEATITNSGTGSTASNQTPAQTPVSTPAPTYTTATLTPDASPVTAAGTVALDGGGATTEQTGTFTLTFNLTDAGLPAYINFRSSPVVVTLHDESKGTSEVASSTAITMDAPVGGSYNDIDNNGDYIVNGSVKFSVTASMNGGSGDFWYATLDSLNYGSSSTTPSGQQVTFPSTYQTSPVLVNS